MEKFTIIREKSTEHGTPGTFYIDGKEVCKTLEDPWNNNQRGISCIPPGVYPVRPHNGAKYKNVWILGNTSPREAILIHAGNTHKDTQGCILVGSAKGLIGGVPGIVNSRATLDKLRGLLPAEFTLHIVGAP